MKEYSWTDLETLPDMKADALSVLLYNHRRLKPVQTGLQSSTVPIDEIKIILFDIYGTLLISQSGDVGSAAEKSRTDIFLSLMEKTNLAPRNHETAEKLETAFFENIRIIHECKKKKGIRFPEVDIINVWDKAYRAVMDDLESPLEPEIKFLLDLSVNYESLANFSSIMPGLEVLLKETVSSGRKMGIISNAQFYTPILLEGLTGSSLKDTGFDPQLTVWSYMEGMGKPSPDLFAKALKKCWEVYKAEPSEVLYVGNDMRNDIFPASRAGMKTALFAGDRRSLRLREKDPLYSYIKPDIILTELKQLTDLL